MIYGNCQAEAMRALFLEVPDFAQRFEIAPVPAVHLVRPQDVSAVHVALSHASLVIAHTVRSGYRGLALGTTDIAPAISGQIVRVPPLYYEGHFPFQVYVHADGELGTPAPRTDYHDLRFAYCAAQGWNDEQAIAWLNTYRPPDAALRSIAAASAARMRARDDEVDIPISQAMDDLLLTRRGFFTVNHPCNDLLRVIVGRVVERLGMSPSYSRSAPESLGHVVTPIEPAVTAALSLAVHPDEAWVIRGETVTTSALLREHMAWYRRVRPDVPKVALDEHAERAAALELR